MKKFITSIIIFTTFFIVIIEIIVQIASLDNLDKNISDNKNIISTQNKSKFDHLDVLFVGNSYCYSGIKPSLLDSVGIKSYNLGIVTAGVKFYEIITNDYLKNIKFQPKIIFVLVSPMTFSSKNDNFAAYPIHRYLENPLSNIDIALKYSSYKKIIPMYKKSLRKGFRNIISNNRSNHNYKVENKGYIYSTETVNPSETKKVEYLYTPLNKERWDNTKFIDLINYVSTLEKKGIKIVYFELPSNKLEKYFSQKYLNSYYMHVNNLAKTNNFLRVNKSLFSEKDFKNIDHMNDSGAEIATKEVIRYLYDTFGMGDKKGPSKKVN